MSKRELVKRYIVFFCGLLCNAFGVALATKSGLGASPIAAIPYALSLVLDFFTMGNWVIVFNVSLVIIQWIILKDKANKIELILQAVMAFCFGYFTDFALGVLSGFEPANYAIRLISLIGGCFALGLGVFLALIGNVVMLPGDAFSRTISGALHKEYGTVRTISDVSMSVIAGLISLVFLHKLAAVREGTIIAALLVGSIITLWKKILAPLGTALTQWFCK